jgi:subfamily B ATP-binding cassette protein MsbA
MSVAPATRPAGAPSASPPAKPPAKPPVSLAQVWPEVWSLVRPRRAKIGLGLLLMGVNRVSGLVLPWSTKSLIDDVIGRRQAELLMPLVGGVVAATVIQGVTSFTLTQLLSKEAQRLIAEMRVKVQTHISRLPVATRPARWSRASCPTSRACGT